MLSYSALTSMMVLAIQTLRSNQQDISLKEFTVTDFGQRELYKKCAYDNVLSHLFRRAEDINSFLNDSKSFRTGKVVKRHVWWRVNSSDFSLNRRKRSVDKDIVSMPMLEDFKSDVNTRQFLNFAGKSDNQKNSLGLISRALLQRILKRQSPTASKRTTLFDTLQVRHKRSSFTCCETYLSAVSPATVEYNGKTYDVYHPGNSYQIYFEGTCGSGGPIPCGDGKCVEDNYRLIWILIVDFSLTYNPPIQFVPIEYPGHCFCSQAS